MHQLIDKIRNSTPTHIGDKAWSMLCDVFSRDDYVIFSSSIHGMSEIIELAETFVNVIAHYEMNPGEFVKIHDPLFLSISSFPEKPDAYFYLLYYSNGHIVLVEDNNTYELLVLIEKTYLDSINYEYKDIRSVIADGLVQLSEQLSHNLSTQKDSNDQI